MNVQAQVDARSTAGFGAPHIIARSTQPVAVDLEAALSDPRWRENVAFFVSLAEANHIGAAQVDRALAFAFSLDDETARDAVLLALPNILGYGRAIVLTALLASRAAERSEKLAGTSPEFLYLTTGEGSPRGRGDQILAPAEARFEFFRRVARVHSWSGFAGLPGALLKPDAVVIGHNALLRRGAVLNPGRLDFRRAERILNEARRRLSPATVTHSASLAELMLRDADIAEPFRSRAAAVLQATCKPHLETAARDITALRETRLPGEVWAASGGLYASRAVGIEVLRRGGRVRRFDHGKPRGFIDRYDVDTLLEYSVSSDFVVPTSGVAELARHYSLKSQYSGYMPPALHHLDGDPGFAKIALPAVVGRHASKPRVVYAPTQLLGFRTLLPMQLPDVVHLNWQMQVCEALQNLPIDFTCHAHPEGYFKGRPHPLEAVARTVRGNYEAALQETDVFIFDCPSTTALWQAACTGAHIVYLDIGGGAMTPPVARLFADRAEIVSIPYDADNRPLLDRERLAAAIFKPVRPDPRPIRALLAGTA